MAKLAHFTVLDAMYANGKLRRIEGAQDASAVSIGTVNYPADTGVPIVKTLPDPVIFSYTHGGALRLLLVKLNSSGGSPSTATYMVIDPANYTYSQDITITAKGGGAVATNPHGLAQKGNMLYLIDYESQNITLLTTDELENAFEKKLATLTTDKPVFSLTATLDNPYARGQAVIIIGNKLYALYLCNTPNASRYFDSILLRLDIAADGTLSYDSTPASGNKTLCGKNAQEIIPVNNKSGEGADDIYLLIPAIGGPQQAGSTNGTASNICAVPALGAWPATAPIKVTGTASGTTWDIYQMAAAMRNKDSAVYIFTVGYVPGWSAAKWTLYKMTVENFLLLVNNSTLDNIAPSIVKSGQSAGYYWAILMEQAAAADGSGDRLWGVFGSPILAALAANFHMPGETPDPSALYQYFNQTEIGGANVNSFDLTIETSHQAARQNVSLKRGLRFAKPPMETEGEEAAK